MEEIEILKKKNHHAEHPFTMSKTGPCTTSQDVWTGVTLGHDGSIG